MSHVELDKYLDALPELKSMFSHRDVSNSVIGCETFDYDHTYIYINYQFNKVKPICEPQVYEGQGQGL